MAQLWLAANLLSEPKAHGGGLLARLLSSSERRAFCLSAVTTSFLKEACEDSWAFCLSRVATSFLREASENSFKKFLKLGYCRIWNKSGGRRQCCRQRASHPSPLPGICVSTPPLRSPPPAAPPSFLQGMITAKRKKAHARTALHRTCHSEPLSLAIKMGETRSPLQNG